MVYLIFSTFCFWVIETFSREKIYSENLAIHNFYIIFEITEFVIFFLIWSESSDEAGQFFRITEIYSQFSYRRFHLASILSTLILLSVSFLWPVSILLTLGRVGADFWRFLGRGATLHQLRVERSRTAASALPRVSEKRESEKLFDWLINVIT